MTGLRPSEIRELRSTVALRRSKLVHMLQHNTSQSFDGKREIAVFGIGSNVFRRAIAETNTVPPILEGIRMKLHITNGSGLCSFRNQVYCSESSRLISGSIKCQFPDKHKNDTEKLKNGWVIWAVQHLRVEFWIGDRDFQYFLQFLGFRLNWCFIEAFSVLITLKVVHWIADELWLRWHSEATCWKEIVVYDWCPQLDMIFWCSSTCIWSLTDYSVAHVYSSQAYAKNF